MTAPVMLSYDTNQRVEGNQVSNVASETPNVGYLLEAVRKISIDSNDVVHLKDEQEKAVNCLLDGRDVPLTL